MSYSPLPEIHTKPMLWRMLLFDPAHEPIQPKLLWPATSIGGKGKVHPFVLDLLFFRHLTAITSLWALQVFDSQHSSHSYIMGHWQHWWQSPWVKSNKSQTIGGETCTKKLGEPVNITVQLASVPRRTANLCLILWWPTVKAFPYWEAHPQLSKQWCNFYKQFELRSKLGVAAPPLISSRVFWEQFFSLPARYSGLIASTYWYFHRLHSCSCMHQASAYSHVSWSVQTDHRGQENLNFSTPKTTVCAAPTVLNLLLVSYAPLHSNK